MTKEILIGTSGYVYRDWRGKFYPNSLRQNQWFSYYTKNFRTVEINASFYKSLKKQTYEKWRELSPEDFKFVIKGNRFITRIKRLKDVDDSVNFFFENVLELKDKLSAVLWQFPPSFKFTDETSQRLKYFLNILPKNLRQALEFRHETWFVEKVYRILKRYNTSLVISQSSKFPQREEITADFIYIRFHGPNGLFSSFYSHKQMSQWAEKINGWKKNYDIYCYFNNDLNANAVKNAKELISLTE